MTSTSDALATLGSRAASRSRVRQFFTDFARLDRLAPGVYPRVIVRGEGSYLYDEEGQRLFDAGHHLAVCQIGHGRAEMAERIAEQVRVLEYTSLEAGVSHLPVIELAERLAPLVPLDEPVFSFCVSGSEANEIAFKLARAYHAARGEPSRVKILARAGSYHGSSYGAMSATGNPALREPFAPLVPGFVRTSQPSPGRCGYCTAETGCNLGCAREIERVIRQEGPKTVAAFLGEPVAVQQAVKVPHPTYWRTVREICDAYGVLLVHDEVVTGWGRLGTWFGGERFGVRADVVTTAKGLTSGYVPMAFCAVSGRVQEAFGTQQSVHVNTYGGHPVACAAAQANLDIMERERLVERAARLEPVLRRELARVEGVDERVFRASAIGLLASVEFAVGSAEEGVELATRIRHGAYERGLLVRFGGDDTSASVYFIPTLIATEQEIVDAFTALRDAVAEAAA